MRPIGAIACILVASGCGPAGAEIDATVSLAPDAGVETSAPGFERDGGCADGACGGSSCFDRRQRGDETDVDCGGSCSPCDDGAGCRTGEDCVSRVCDAGRCVAPRCDDGVRNAFESDVDCGYFCTRCGLGAACGSNVDCESGYCVERTCVAPRCMDWRQNGDETGVDCGGTACAPCPDRSACEIGSDCASGRCDLGRCASCSDRRLSGPEGDVDCGGPCAPCDSALRCRVDSDCASGDCDRFYCASCNDGARNGAETGVDCGGACGACPGAACARPVECASGRCDAGVCGEVAGCPGTLALRPGANVVPWDRVPRRWTEGPVACGLSAGVIGPALSFTASIDGELEIALEKDAHAPLTLLVRPDGCDATSGAHHCADAYYGTELRTRFPIERDRSYRIWILGESTTPEHRLWSAPVRLHLRERVPACADRVRAGGETDVDCGGPGCPPCLAGERCDVDDDCASRLCRGGVCRPSLCGDGARNGTETDVDCGGSACVRCAVGRACDRGADCESGACVGGACAVATCADGVSNGGESGVDCGGPCAPCGDHAYCRVDGDCASGSCLDGLCAGSASCAPIGRDGFGYRGCALSLAPSEMPCPRPSSSAARGSIGADRGARAVALDFPFDFYGAPVDEAILNLAGVLRLGSEVHMAGPTCAGSAPSGAGGVVADDRYASDGWVTAEVTGAAPSRRLVARWEIPRTARSPAELDDFTIVLHESGDVDICYDAVSGTGPREAVGLTRGDGVGMLAAGPGAACSPSTTISAGTVLRFRHP